MTYRDFIDFFASARVYNDDVKMRSATEYIEKVQNEIKRVCGEVLNLLDTYIFFPTFFLY